MFSFLKDKLKSAISKISKKVEEEPIKELEEQKEITKKKKSEIPKKKEQVEERGYSWSDYESEMKYHFPDYEVPNDIKDVKDDILDKILKCEVTDKGYKIIPMELQFYRRFGLPIPRRSPLQRHKDRIAKLHPMRLYHRACTCAGEKSENGVYKNTIAHFHGNDHSPNEFEATYAPERPEIVYCKKCYQAEVA